MKIDTSDMTLVRDLKDHTKIALAQEAARFLTKFRWCAEIKESFLAFNIAEVLDVFLVRIEPRLVGIDNVFWVVVGDVPPAYLVCDDAPDWHSALRCYVYEMKGWIDAVRSGSPLDKVIPVSTSPTLEHARMLESRLAYIQDYVIDGKPFPGASTGAFDTIG